MTSHETSFRRVTNTSSKLIESYCDNCGVFIAASPSLRIVMAMEKLHQCRSSDGLGITKEQLQRLMDDLSRKEPALLAWIQQSDRNRCWFAADPLGAIRAADLGLDEQTVRRLDLIASSIALKLRRPS